MTVAAGPLLLVTLSPNGSRLVLRGAPLAANDFIRSLPGARWLQSERAWTVEATPATAHAVAGSRFCAVESDEPVAAMAHRFAESVAAAARALAAEQLEQPAKRVKDSWKNQLRAYHFAAALDAALIPLKMGRGKSKVVCDLVANQGDKLALILCPTAVRGVWRREFFKHAPHLSDCVCVLDCDGVKQKLKEAVAFESRQARLGRPAIFALNFESAWREPFAQWALTREWDRIVVDESHRIFAHNSKISKFCGKLSRVARKRICLSGTPLANSPLDVFGQYRFLDPGIFGTSWHRFSNMFALMSEQFPGMVLQYRNRAELAARMALLACQVEDDVTDLPPETHTVLPVKLCAEAARVYRALEREMIADVHGGVVTVANALVRGCRLQQATSGYSVTDSEKKIVDLGGDKAVALRDWLFDVEPVEPVVVFCRFREDLDRVADLAAQIGRVYGELSGRRHDLTEHSTMPDDVQLMGVQYQSGSVGVDLTRAATAVYYSGTWSLAEFDQSVARLNRPGQTRPVQCIHLAAAGTIDERIARAVEEKREVIDVVLTYMREAR